MTDASSDVVYFGARNGDRYGHYFQYADNTMVEEKTLPMPRALLTPHPDSRWCWRTPRTREEIRNRGPSDNPEIQGEGFIHYQHGWTIISWWDRSGDPRHGANATFFLRGRHRWTEALARAREAFPRVFARIEAAYCVFLAGDDLPDIPPAP